MRDDALVKERDSLAVLSLDGCVLVRRLIAVAVLLVLSSLAVDLLAVHTDVDHGGSWAAPERQDPLSRAGEQRAPLAALGAAHRLLCLGREGNIPTFYSAVLLGLGALLALALARVSRPGSASEGRWWAGAGIVLGYLSVDEAVGIHEKWQLLARGPLAGLAPAHTPWVFPGAIAIVAVALTFAPFVTRLPADTRGLLIAAGAVYVTGCLGMETAGSAMRSAQATETTLIVLVTVEETLEMAGAIIAIAGLLRHISVHEHGLRVGIT